MGSLQKRVWWKISGLGGGSFFYKVASVYTVCIVASGISLKFVYALPAVVTLTAGRGSLRLSCDTAGKLIAREFPPFSRDDKSRVWRILFSRRAFKK